MKHCARCILPESFPGISLGEDGVCSVCRTWEQGEDKRREGQDHHLELFRRLVDKTRESRAHAGGSYDLLMAYSGGKDSTFTLGVLCRRFGLKVLALTFDNGFMAPGARENIRKVTTALGVDHLMVTPAFDTLRKAFAASVSGHRYPRKALERASPICQTCMGMVKGTMLRTAIEKEIPLLGYGWSPGQAPLASSLMKMNPSLLRQTQRSLEAGLRAVMGTHAEDYLLRDRHYRLLDAAVERYGGEFLHHVHPLAFLPYDEEDIVKEIAPLGWVPPGGTDSNSTNCLLNSFAIKVHQENYSFHPYATEVAGLVRDGCMSREEGMAKLAKDPDPRIVEEVGRRLGISRGPGGTGVTR